MNTKTSENLILVLRGIFLILASVGFASLGLLLSGYLRFDLQQGPAEAPAGISQPKEPCPCISEWGDVYPHYLWSESEAIPYDLLPMELP